MSERTKKIFYRIMLAVIFIACISLVIAGHRHTGPAGLCVMLIGFAGLIILLWLYNRQFK